MKWSSEAQLIDSANSLSSRTQLKVLVYAILRTSELEIYLKIVTWLGVNYLYMYTCINFAYFRFWFSELSFSVDDKNICGYVFAFSHHFGEI